MNSKLIIEKLTDACPNIQFTEDAKMKEYTTFKAGGTAKLLVEPMTKKELKEILRIINGENIKFILIGNGSNTLFRDGSYDGIVVKLSDKGGDLSSYEMLDSNTVKIGASMLMSAAAKHVFMENSLAGFEELSGIPGSVGGALFMNGGAYNKEMKDVVIGAHGISVDGLTEKDFNYEELDLSYRHSAFMDGKYILTDVTFRLQNGNKEEIAWKINDFTARRKSKQPLMYGSAGSTFKRPTGYFAAKLIDDAGLKGVHVGDAEVSIMHSGFIVNKGNATATEILELIDIVKKTVYEKFGVMLEEEVRII